MVQINDCTPVYVAAGFGETETVSMLIEVKCDTEKGAVRESAEGDWERGWVGREGRREKK